MLILDGKYVNKEANNEQDKVANSFVGYRPGISDYRYSVLAVVVKSRIILWVVSETVGWVFDPIF
jgi:hypothetical protein